MNTHIELTLIDHEPENGELIKWQCFDGTVTIYVYKVMFGHRLRAGYSDDRWGVNVDWCLGPVGIESDLFTKVLDRLLAMLEANRLQGHGYGLFHNIPTCSSIKPLFLDANFLFSIGLTSETRT